MDWKKVIVVVVVALVLFFLISQPGQSAQTVKDILGALRDGAEAIISFIRHLFA